MLDLFMLLDEATDITCGGIVMDPIIPAITSTVVSAIKYIVPIILVVFGMIDLMKAVTAGDEKVMKETNIQNFLDRTLISLSDGERSRVLLAEALIRNTSLLLLDEPTAFLDVPRSIDLFKLLKSIAVNENKGILISTHQVEHALKYADRLLVFLRNGQVVSGLVEDVLKSGALSWAELD